jgi:hypothetical protein
LLSLSLASVFELRDPEAADGSDVNLPGSRPRLISDHLSGVETVAPGQCRTPYGAAIAWPLQDFAVGSFIAAADQFRAQHPQIVDYGLLPAVHAAEFPSSAVTTT